MSSAVKLILGVSTLAMVAAFAGCDSGSSDTGGGAGVVVVPGGAGTGNSAAGTGTAGASTGGAPAGGGSAGATTTGPAGVPLTPAEGWITTSIGIQGPVISYADDVSKVSLVNNFTGSSACISGTAAKVDKASDVCVNMTWTGTAHDCYGQFWGVAMPLI